MAQNKIAQDKIAQGKIEPFKIEVSDEVLADLRARLERTRLPDEVPGSAWDYGTNLAYLRELIDYWRTRTTGARTSGRSIASPISAPRPAARTCTSSTSAAAAPIPSRCCCCTDGRGRCTSSWS